MSSHRDAILTIQCPDQRGIVAKISDFIFHHDGNIVQSDQYTTDPEDGLFFMRIAFRFDGKKHPIKKMEEDFAKLAKALKARWNIHYSHQKKRMGILVSKTGHCLIDLLYRVKSGELPVDVTCVVSNHEDLKKDVRAAGIPFYFVPQTKTRKPIQEKEILEHVRQTTDFLVLARYMQILSKSFLDQYDRDIINIHHSFLPSFQGANPYQQAYDRGVKVIGATAHYVTENLDEGPIIEQIVDHISHRDDLEKMRQKSRNLEKIALANAISAHIENRIVRYQNKTVVF